MAEPAGPGQATPVKPRVFFLNERQELLALEPAGGGRSASPTGIDWPVKSERLTASFRTAASASARSVDPASQAGHLFLVAQPEDKVEKLSKKQTGETSTRDELPAFGGDHALEFRKINMDLLGLRDDGSALVHLLKRDAAKLESKLVSLAAGQTRAANEESRWARFKQFGMIDVYDKISRSWVDAIEPGVAVEAMVRFFPVLSRQLFQQVIEAVAEVAAGHGSKVLRTGRDLTGAFWCTSRLTGQAVLRIAEMFASVRWIHEPHDVRVFGDHAHGPVDDALAHTVANTNISLLPKLAIVDVGLPHTHRVLDSYRLGQYSPPRATAQTFPHHGSQVASAAIFGPIRGASVLAQIPRPACRIYSIDIGIADDTVDPHLAVDAMAATRGFDAELRVFVLSFGSRIPFASLDSVARQQYLTRLAELETFAFDHDVVLVIAAGNTIPGQQPASPYPKHVTDPAWSLGVEALSYNALVVGGLVHEKVDGGVGAERGAPSPFTRIGPGILNSSVPGFSAHAGDVDSNYRLLAGAGLKVCDASAKWKEVVGTSYAAPYVAREATMALAALAMRCRNGTVPFAATAKAYLHLTANRPQLPPRLEMLAARTLGVGLPRAARLLEPRNETAVFVWQTVLPQQRIEHRVRFPVPGQWLSAAGKPVLRVVCAWLTPVNDALHRGSWATRSVTVHVHPFGEKPALRGRGTTKGNYPLHDRIFDIRSEHLRESGFNPTEDDWIIAVSYQTIGPDLAGMTVDPHQRVGVVFELRDDDEEPLSPQEAIQALPVAAELDFLPVYLSKSAVQVRVDT